MFQLTGVPADEAAKKAATVMRIETDLAQGSLDIVARRDPKKLVHKYASQRPRGAEPGVSISSNISCKSKLAGFETLNIERPISSRRSTR